MKIKLLSKIKEEMNMGTDKISLTVSGMTCMHCAGTVKKAVESIEGTSNVVVDLDKEMVEFEMEEKGNTEKVKKAIELAGYNAG
ncbi:MAG: heavy metal-associated domain-containing protein [Syntrophales bacterium]|nr:heavy metal-associated domain-containing protein [Syntrophales bacterium]